MKTDVRSDIFKAEFTVLESAKKTLHTFSAAENPILPQFENLYLGYKKLLHQTMQLITIGDRQQDRLLNLQNVIAQKNRELEKEQTLASKVQSNILSMNLQLKGFETGIYYKPSNMVGGDFFDAHETRNTTHFLIGDISGHSTSSALLMAVCHGMFRSLGQSMESPLEIVTSANRMLCQMLMDSGMFLSLAYMILDHEQNVLRVISAGHNPVYLFNGKGMATIESSGPVLGWDQEDTWGTQEFEFPSGSALFLYTDGLVEAKNSNGEEFESRLIELLRKTEAAPVDLVTMLLNDVTDFCKGTFDDDLTMFAVKRL